VAEDRPAGGEKNAGQNGDIETVYLKANRT
jgi:hypothetical protein